MLVFKIIKTYVFKFFKIISLNSYDLIRNSINFTTHINENNLKKEALESNQLKNDDGNGTDGGTTTGLKKIKKGKS